MIKAYNYAISACLYSLQAGLICNAKDYPRPKRMMKFKCDVIR